jgi:hypothetical protein
MTADAPFAAGTYGRGCNRHVVAVAVLSVAAAAREHERRREHGGVDCAIERDRYRRAA